ncbi:T9SS type A sorting domain-containing protein [Flavobacteriales bacterium]|nr:T9SS type A sorting domain-containing protein [Flavobacteriales bacterium]
MNKILLLPFILFTSTLFAQEPCSQIDFVSIQYCPFTDTVIVVHVENNSAELFDYPGFVLIDISGDTVAKEQVHLFGIGSESVHTLEVRPGLHNPLNDFVGDLELHTGFFDTFECEWPMNQSLCANEPCDSLIIAFENWGGALVLGDFDWSINDGEGSVVESGTFTMDSIDQYWERGFCLLPDTYAYTLTALGQPSGGGPVMTATSSQPFFSPMIIEYFEWFNQLTKVMEIPFFSFCAEPPNGIGNLSSNNEIHLRYEMALNQLISSQQIVGLHIYSAAGRLVYSANPKVKQVVLPILATGTYIAAVSTSKGEAMLRLILR